MYKEQPDFHKPQSRKAKIWRYMDFTKFMSLLDRHELFFARADRLSDPFEGSYPRENVRQRTRMHETMLKRLPTVLKAVYERTPKGWSEFYRNLPRFIFINSWHENNQESAAMWTLYLKSSEGIAVQSTFGRLADCFGRETPDVYVGEVRYRDYSREMIAESSLFSPFLHKRRSFEHEKELRAVFLAYDITRDGLPNLSKPLSQDGIGVPVDLDKLIANIYVAPTSPKWFYELVKSVTRKYELNKPVLQSALDAKPIY